MLSLPSLRRLASLAVGAALALPGFGGARAQALSVDAAPLIGAVPHHHRAQGFQNNYLEFEPKGFGDLLRWRIDALREGLPRPPRTVTPMVPADIAFVHANGRAGLRMEPALTWIGHATMLAQFGGINLLTDPMFSERASPVGFIGPKRHVAPGIALAELPHIDVVLISHDHYDHLDDASVRGLNSQPGGPPLFIVPLGVKTWMAKRDIGNVIELDWGQSRRVGAVEIVLTPVQHWSGRGLTDRLATLWGGYAVFAPDLHLFFSGDTGYSKDFTDIRNRFAQRQTTALGGGFDVALIPIGAYGPRWFMASQHVNPAEAVQIHVDLGAKRSVGIHWGIFELTDESLDEPPQEIAQERRARGLTDEAFTVFAVGETRRLPRRGATTAGAGTAVPTP
jgi:N-acyl-phosphatidylethanolamine-hydrolysing phospholipase D